MLAILLKHCYFFHLYMLNQLLELKLSFLKGYSCNSSYYFKDLVKILLFLTFASYLSTYLLSCLAFAIQPYINAKDNQGYNISL